MIIEWRVRDGLALQSLALKHLEKAQYHETEMAKFKVSEPRKYAKHYVAAEKHKIAAEFYSSGDERLGRIRGREADQATRNTE